MIDRTNKLSKSKVIMMCGPAGSGKSAYARKLEKEGMIILSYDDESFNRGITDHPLPENIAQEIKDVLDRKLISLIEMNADILLDYSFWSIAMRSEYISLLSEYGIKPIICYIKVPKETAMDRIRKRSGNHKNEIRLTEEMASLYFDHFQEPSEDEGEIIVIKGY